MTAPKSRHIPFMSLLRNAERRAVVDYKCRGCFHCNGLRLELSGGAVPRARVECWAGGGPTTITNVGRGTLSERDLERLDGMIDLFFLDLGVSTTTESISLGWYDGDEFIGEGTYHDSSTRIRDDEHVLHVRSLADRLTTGETANSWTDEEDSPLPGKDERRAKRAQQEAKERAAATGLLLSTLRTSTDAWTEAREATQRIAQDASSPTDDPRLGRLDRIAIGIKQWTFEQLPGDAWADTRGFGSELREALIQGVPLRGATFRIDGPEHCKSDTDMVYHTYLSPVDWHAVATELLGEI